MDKTKSKYNMGQLTINQIQTENITKIKRSKRGTKNSLPINPSKEMLFEPCISNKATKLKEDEGIDVK